MARLHDGSGVTISFWKITLSRGLSATLLESLNGLLWLSCPALGRALSLQVSLCSQSVEEVVPVPPSLSAVVCSLLRPRF